MSDYTSIELDKIVFRTPTKIDGKYIGRIVYNNEELIIKVPYLRCMDKVNDKYLELELDTDDKDLYEFFADMDDMSMNSAYQRSSKWFGEQMPLDVIDEYYRRYIRYNSRLQKPYIRVNISGINVDDIKRDVLVSCVIRCDGLKFYKQQFMGEWSLVEYQVENNYEFKENIVESDMDEMVDNIVDGYLEKNLETCEGDINEEEKVSEEVIDDKEKVINKEDEIMNEEEEKKVINEEENINEEKVMKEGEVKENEKRKKRKPRIIKYAHRNRIWNN